jgi:hypothetical protein
VTDFKRFSALYFAQFADRPWRTGRKSPTNLYAVLGGEPSDEDPAIGVMFSALLARDAVRAHNEELARG